MIGARACTLAASLLAAGLPAAALTIEILQPALVVNDPAFVAVKVDGGTAGQTVTASIGGVSGALAKGSVCAPTTLDPPPCVPQPAWVGNVALSTLPSGEHNLVVTASDGSGGSSSASRTVFLDRKPAIVVNTPKAFSATWMQVQVSASCSDDFECVSISVSSTSTPQQLQGTNQVEGVFDLSMHDGRETSLVFSARDSRGQVSAVAVPLFVEGSPHVRAVATVPGESLDADTARILHRDGDRLLIRDRASGIDTQIHSGLAIRNAALTEAGAAFVVGGQQTDRSAKSWESGTLVDLGNAGCCYLSTAGRHMLWPGPTEGQLRWRDVVTGDTREISTTARATASDIPAGLAASGAVAFWSTPTPGAGPYELMLFEPAALPQVRSLLPSVACTHGPPSTDGVTVAFAKADDCTLYFPRVYTHRNGTVTQLALVAAGSLGFEVSGGWIGVARRPSSPDSPDELWRYDPAGTARSIAIAGDPAKTSLDRIHSDGTLTSGLLRRYVTPPTGSQSFLVGSRRGKALFIADALHVALGDTLFAYDRAVPAPEPLSHAFGSASMGSATAPKPVTLTNDSAAAITVTSVAASASFRQANDCGTLGAGQSCTVQVAFAPGPVTSALNASVDMPGTLTIASSGAAAPIRVALWGTGERSFVTHYYRSILRREPDPGGKAFWQDEASRTFSLGADVNEAWFAMAAAFFGSAEYAGTARADSAFVTDLYAAFLGRAPDDGGLAYWAGELGSGLPREVLLAAFMFSPEFTGLSRSVYGSGPGRAEMDMVMDLYRGFLGRLPDSGGFGYWIQRFRAAQCQGGAAVQAEVDSMSSAFANSAEYGARQRSDTLFVADLYNAFLRRGGDRDGVRFWIGQLEGGARSREQLRREFMTSPEFSARVNAVVAQGCLP